MKTVQDLKEDYNETLSLLEQAQLSSDWKTLGELNKKKENIEKVINLLNQSAQLENKLSQTEEIINSNLEQELVTLAKEEKLSLLDQQSQLQKQIKEILEEKKEEQSDSVIIEIRAGTGGEEAALFAANLFNMYFKYAESKLWQTRILDSSKTELGGIKEIVFEIVGTEAYSKMKYEGGVHRVQRIPETEKSGRIHTSTAAVAVLPKPTKSQVTIKPDEIITESYHSSGPGGQYVNKRETAIRITHIPTGLVVTCQTERSLASNKENALSILEAKILQAQEESQNAKMQDDRRSQVGKMERSEKIRTYNYPQDRVTDHRIKKSWHNLEEIMMGKLDQIIDELEKEINK
ncbi:MAG: peptide chain release factor 1 [Candidatus Pacebacteria bacterium]|nr:peptide chain release factor 1 [Candidatus Paceibacterota bacterium]